MNHPKDGYPIHPYAKLFPLHDGPPLWALRDDIKANGLRDEIVLYQGNVLDGRRRQVCCLYVEVEPRYVLFQGNDAEALKFVVSKNLHRRHLGEAERAMVAAKIAKLKPGQKTSTKPDLPIGESDKESGNIASRSEAAALMNVSERAVDRAKVVAERGTAKLQDAVKQGDVSLSDAAKVATEPAMVQDQAVKDTKAGKARTASEAVAHATKTKASKNGAELFDWRKFKSDWGNLLRQVDTFGNAYEVKDTPKAQEFRDRLDQWKADFEQWSETIRKQKAPE